MEKNSNLGAYLEGKNQVITKLVVRSFNIAIFIVLLASLSYCHIGEVFLYLSHSVSNLIFLLSKWPQ